MPIKLYDANPSANSDRVKLVLHERSSRERITLNLRKREQKTEQFLRLNPYGKVPVLVDGDKVLFESCIINEYLNEQYPDPPLMPTDPYLRARGRVVVDYMLNFLQPDWTPFRFEMLKPAPEQDTTVIEQQRPILLAHLRYIEDALGDEPYFCGASGLTDIDVWLRFALMEIFTAFARTFLAAAQWPIGRMRSRLSA